MSTALAAETKHAALQDLRLAVFHLASYWDALRELETKLGIDVEMNAIYGMTADIKEPNDAFYFGVEALDDLILSQTSEAPDAA